MIFYTVAMSILFTLLALCATLVIWTYLKKEEN
jgi:hypothetical protein